MVEKVTMRYQTVQICVDDSMIAAGDPWAVIEPVWWLANIYDGPQEYELSLLQFSPSQRLLFAVIWYCSEVNNGGHHQFYSNPTGIVWKDALAGFWSLEASKLASVLAESAECLGGLPSLDRQERWTQLETFSPDFNELDKRFYEAETEEDLEGRMTRFIQARPSDFYFDGKVRRLILPVSD